MALINATFLHAVGHRFESCIAHHKPACEAGLFIPASPTTLHVLPLAQVSDLLISIFPFLPTACFATQPL